MHAIIMAGGKGTRLKPYTTLIPKPLVPIGNERAILEIILMQLIKHKINRVTLCVNHLANLIMAYFGDGSRWGVKIDYSIEETPLSTIGPLTLIDNLEENFIVMNGDVLCDIDFSAFYNKHVDEKRDVTVAVAKRETKVDFGVITYNADNKITDFYEKPVSLINVSMGIYCINKKVILNLERGVKFGFDDLMYQGVRENLGFSVFPFDGFWLDIGRPEDYDFCNENYESLKYRLGLGT